MQEAGVDVGAGGDDGAISEGYIAVCWERCVHWLAN